MKEFAEDLDHVRSADDFDNKSLPVLVTALKQGVTILSPKERERIMYARRG